MVSIPCAECQRECEEGGGLCAPLDYDSIEAARSVGITNPKKARLDHRRDDHPMALRGGNWRCGKCGHLTEAEPAVVMRAAGIQPML